MIDLSQFDHAFETAPASDLNDVPDGRYEVVIDGAGLGESKSSRRPMIKWVLQISGPQYVGRKLWRNSVITEKTIRWLKRDLLICGLDLGRFSDLPERLTQLTGVALEITKASRGEKTSIYFNHRIDPPDLDEEDIPF